MEKAKPFIKWVGGKGQLLGQLRKFYPKDFGTYLEPFLGGGAVFFDICPKKAVLNDINPTLIGVYKHIRDDHRKVISILEDLAALYRRKNEEKRKELFYEIRKEFNSLPDGSIKKSAYFIFLNKTGFNGMYRESSKGIFNVPFGKYKNPNIANTEVISAASKALRGAKLSVASFDKAVKSAKKGDFIYFDPPYYPVSKTANFTGYHEKGFFEREQRQLKRIFDELSKKGCFVMLSNSYTPFIKDLYKGYRQEVVMANRAINCKASGRGKIKELVILNY